MDNLTRLQDVILNRPADTRLVFLSDYDGTLADFDPDPSIPRPSALIRQELGRLADRRDLTLGIVSGRRVADLRTRTQLPARVYLAGLHGMEIEAGTRRWQHPHLDAARHHVRALIERLEEVRARTPGLVLEDKHVSVAVHVRGVSPDERDRALALADECAARWVEQRLLRRLTGKLVLEYLPNIACHKGDATRWIARDVEEHYDQPVWIVFVGDDVTDEDAFEALDGDGIGVLVGDRPTAATHRLDGVDDVEALLTWLTRLSPGDDTR